MKAYNRKKKPKHTTRGKYVKHYLFDGYYMCISKYTKKRSELCGSLGNYIKIFRDILGEMREL